MTGFPGLHRSTNGAPVSSESAQPQVREYVSILKTIQLQVGDHVVAVLQQPDTVAVLTTVMAAGDGSQRIVSVGLDAGAMDQVQQLFQNAQAQHAPTQQTPCIGFHCYTKQPDAA